MRGGHPPPPRTCTTTGTTAPLHFNPPTSFHILSTTSLAAEYFYDFEHLNISITSPRGIASPFFPSDRAAVALVPLPSLPLRAASLRPSGEVAVATHEGEERRDEMQWSWVPETHPWWCARKEERMDAQRWLGPFPPRETRAAFVSVKEPVWIRAQGQTSSSPSCWLDQPERTDEKWATE